MPTDEGRTDGDLREVHCDEATEGALFLYGFAKSERANIRPDQLARLKLYAQRWLGLDDEKIARAINRRAAGASH